MKKHKFNIFPEMDGEEFSRLVEDISANGFDARSPVFTYQGEVLDGWHRFKACEKLGITPATAVFTGSDLDAVDFVMRSNKRRNITSQQWAAIAVSADEIVEAIASAVEAERLEKQRANAANQHSEPLGKKLPQASEVLAPAELSYEIEQKTDTRDRFKTSTKIAQSFNTNRTYVQQAAKLKREDPEKFEAVKQGATTFQQIKKEKPTVKDLLDDSESDNVTRLCKEYGSRYLKLFREFDALTLDARSAFQAQGASFFDFSGSITKPNFMEPLEIDARILKRFVKCPVCNAKKCEHCKQRGYIDGDKKAQVLDRVEYIKKGGVTA